MWCSIRYRHPLPTRDICAYNSSKTGCKIGRSWEGCLWSTCRSQGARKSVLPLDQSLTSVRHTLRKHDLFRIQPLHGLVSDKAVMLLSIDAHIHLLVYMVSTPWLTPAHRVANCSISKMQVYSTSCSPPLPVILVSDPFPPHDWFLSPSRHFLHHISLQHRSSRSCLHRDRCRLRFWLRIWI